MDYWHVECSSCGLNFRLTVDDDDFGKEVFAFCPKCNERTHTIIGIPAKPTLTEEEYIPPETAEKVAKLVEIIGESERVSELISSIYEDGYDTYLLLGLQKNELKDTKLKPKVDKGGQVITGTFTKQDEEYFLKAFRIKLE